MQNRVLPFRWLVAALPGHFPVRHQHADLSAQMFLVKAERLSAVATVVEISVHFHRFTSPLGNSSNDQKETESRRSLTVIQQFHQLFSRSRNSASQEDGSGRSGRSFRLLDRHAEGLRRNALRQRRQHHAGATRSIWPEESSRNRRMPVRRY